MNESIATSQEEANVKLQTGLSEFWRLLDDGSRRMLDITLAVCGGLILSPIFILLAVLIKRDSPGPIFYWGTRVGKDGRLFRILKFRTMYENGDSYHGPKVTGRGDSRITPLGQWLRDTKLNELPQLYNVLKGEMSLVGPRPEDREFVEHWPEAAREILLSVRPGITSPASVLYRDEEKLLSSGNVVDQYLKVILPSKLRLDMLYVHHRSFLTDLDVIFWTLLALLPQIKTKRVPEHLLFWGPLAQFISRYFSWFVLDSLAAFVAVSVTAVIWRSTAPLELGWGLAIGVALAIALIFSLVNALLGIGRVVWSRADINDALALAASSALTTTILVFINFMWEPRGTPVPYLGRQLLSSAMIIVSGVLAFLGFVILRYRMRIITGLSTHWITLRGKSVQVGERVLIIGAGEAGHLASLLLRKADLGQAFTIVGMVDDELRKLGARIGGLQVLGSTDDIPHLINLHDIGLIVFAIENIHPAQRERILRACRSTGAQTIILPDVLEALREQLAGQSSASFTFTANGTTPSGNLGLDDCLNELDGLMQAESWEAAHAYIQDMRRNLVVQNYSANA